MDINTPMIAQADATLYGNVEIEYVKKDAVINKNAADADILSP